MITRRALVAGAAAGAALHALPAHAQQRPQGDAAVLARLLRIERALADAPHAAQHIDRLERTVAEIGCPLPAPADAATVAAELGVAPAELERALLREWVGAIGKLADQRWIQLGASIAGSHAQQLALRDGLAGPFV